MTQLPGVETHRGDPGMPPALVKSSCCQVSLMTRLPAVQTNRGSPNMPSALVKSSSWLGSQEYELIEVAQKWVFPLEV